MGGGGGALLKHSERVSAVEVEGGGLKTRAREATAKRILPAPFYFLLSQVFFFLHFKKGKISFGAQIFSFFFFAAGKLLLCENGGEVPARERSGRRQQKKENEFCARVSHLKHSRTNLNANFHGMKCWPGWRFPLFLPLRIPSRYEIKKSLVEEVNFSGRRRIHQSGVGGRKEGGNGPERKNNKAEKKKKSSLRGRIYLNMRSRI